MLLGNKIGKITKLCGCQKGFKKIETKGEEPLEIKGWGSQGKKGNFMHVRCKIFWGANLCKETSINPIVLFPEKILWYFCVLQWITTVWNWKSQHVNIVIRVHLLIYQSNHIFCLTNVNQNRLLNVRKVHSKLNSIRGKGNSENPFSGVILVCFFFFFPLESTRKKKTIQRNYKIEFVRMLKS